MKILKISQNIEYLNGIGVPAQSQQEILDYLLSLDKESRKVILNKIKKTPNINLSQIKEIETDTKKDYLKGHGYEEKIIDKAMSISPKYAVWLAREIKGLQQMAINNYNNFINYATEICSKYNVKEIYEAQEYMTKEEKQKIIQLQSTKPMINEGNAYRPEMVPWNNVSEVRDVIDYIEQNNPNIMSMSYAEAQKASEKWHEELKAQQEKETIASYKSNNVVYQLPNQWKIVKLSPGDCETEGDLMGHCSKGYARDVEEGRTQLFSLRDPQNKPHVTLEMKFYERSPALNNEKGGIETIQIKGKGNDDPIPEYKAMIKQWFDNLKNEGYEFDPLEDETGDKKSVKDIEDLDNAMNDYGIITNLWGLGGNVAQYSENIMEAYQSGGSSQWSERTAKKYIDDLISYAKNHNELNELEEAFNGFSDQANEWWDDNLYYIDFENPRPDEEDYPNKNDFMMPPKVPEGQIEFQNMPPALPTFNEKAYNKALKAYEEKEKAYEKEMSEHEKYFEPYIFTSYFYEQLGMAKQRKKTKQNRMIKDTVYPEKAAKMKTKIYKIAKKETPGVEASAQYIESLKLYAQEHPNLDRKYIKLIESLPSARKVRMDFSYEECKVLYETLDYLWKKITGEHIIQEKEIIASPETLFGNYWLLKNGILLKGTNHFTIIKQNANLFCSLLNLNGMALQEYLCNKPNKLIRYILNNGGVRLFVNKNRELYAQISSDTYGKWGKSKIKKYDFKTKAVKVIDFKTAYNGWKSGITIKL